MVYYEARVSHCKDGDEYAESPSFREGLPSSDQPTTFGRQSPALTDPTQHTTTLHAEARAYHVQVDISEPPLSTTLTDATPKSGRIVTIMRSQCEAPLHHVHEHFAQVDTRSSDEDLIRIWKATSVFLGGRSKRKREKRGRALTPVKDDDWEMDLEGEMGLDDVAGE
ncbi:hypothetical protein K458DRAFT_381423 [Lentithecium fluviatile CBS 122367]|uniref:Uncharacterized protein n=1 Tax=Lentithecium fluviatile CBS 122367 TaxID=1168545 RepID=A0A6G1JM62_9PLEO|nr:hypothetical protein K458DRAFT_381423 [Lentithecium fluviatile CBS 122367]